MCATSVSSPGPPGALLAQAGHEPSGGGAIPAIAFRTSSVDTAAACCANAPAGGGLPGFAGAFAADAEAWGWLLLAVASGCG